MRIKSFVISILMMSAVAIILLLALSFFTYEFKWHADKALIGITFTYIIAGFVGGWTKRLLSETHSTTKKLMEGIFIGTIFMAILMTLSMVLLGNSFVISSRFLMIWMLLVGSACLGRIL